MPEFKQDESAHYAGLFENLTEEQQEEWRENGKVEGLEK